MSAPLISITAASIASGDCTRRPIDERSANWRSLSYQKAHTCHAAMASDAPAADCIRKMRDSCYCFVVVVSMR